MSARDINLERAIFCLPGVVQYLDGSGNRVTPVLGRLGGTATMGDGSTSSTLPDLLKPRGFATGDSGGLVPDAPAAPGAGSYVDLGDDDLLTQASGFTLAALVYAADGGSLMAKDGSGATDGEFRWSISGSAASLAVIDDTAGAYISRRTLTGSLAERRWVVAVATWDGSAGATGIQLYTDGERVDDTSDTSGTFGALRNTSQALRVGRNQTALPSQYDGLVVLPTMFAGALSAADVSLLTARMKKLARIP